MPQFENPEDKLYLAKILSGGNIKKFEKDYKHNFDFRPVKIKRKEFNIMRNSIYRKLANKYGEKCMLNLDKTCLKNKQLQIDHLIPLSSNILNKKLRNIKPVKRKKVITQSLGSNHIDNLVIACSKCNENKKHRFVKSCFIYNVKKFKVILIKIF